MDRNDTLIGMTDYVLEQRKKMENYAENNIIFSSHLNLMKTLNYANFLKQPLELWMLVPCDENGNVLKEEVIDEELCKYCPLESSKFDSKGNSCEGSRCDVAAENYKDIYQQAKERCLFEDESKDLVNIFLINDMCTIEQLVKYKLKLTTYSKNLISF